MSSKKKLEQILEYFINDEVEKASSLFKTYMIEEAAQIHQRLIENEEEILEMDRDFTVNDMGDDFADDIKADKEEIDFEENLGEDEDFSDEESIVDDMSTDDAVDDLDMDMDLDLDGEETPEVDTTEELDIEDVDDKVSELENDVVDLEDEFEKLSAEFEKIKNDEEVEHDEDYDDDGVIGDEEITDEADFDAEDDFEDDSIEESVLHNVKADNKDKAPGSGDKSPIPVAKDRVPSLGGKPVKIVDKGHKGFEPERKAVAKVTKHTNTVAKGSDALSKVSVKTKDVAPGAGASPAMPKGK